MKKIFALIMLVVFSAGFAFAGDVTLEGLQSQIKDLQGQMLNLTMRMQKNTLHRVKDKVDISAELRSKVDSISYKDMRALPAMANDMMGLWMRGYISNLDSAGAPAAANTWDANGDGLNDAWLTTYHDDFKTVADNLLADPEVMQMFQSPSMQTWFTNNAASIGAVGTNAGFDMTTQQGQYEAGLLYYMTTVMNSTTVSSDNVALLQKFFKAMKPRKYEHNNSSIFTNRLRIRLSSRVNEHLSFTGRLVMYKVWGDSTGDRWFNGTQNSMYLDGNAGAVPTDDKLHVERAYFVYKNQIGQIPWDVSFGRRPADFGPGFENKEYGPLGGSPLPQIIQYQFDGISLQFNFEDMFESLPGSFIKFCYGRGYENGWGSSNALGANNGLIASPSPKDVDLAGLIIKFYDDEDYKVWYNYARGFNVTDGFTGTTVMPFVVTGQDNNLDGNYDEYEFTPNYFGSTSRMEPTSKVGDMEWHSFLVQGHTFGFSWFTSVAMSKSHPSGHSHNAMYQFMEMDKMLGSNKSKTGNAIWVGIETPALPLTKGKFGVEYNQGSKYWVSMTAAEDDLVGSKLAVRGKVFEAYYHQPIMGERLFTTIGYQHFDYDYTGSGNYLGAPVKIADATAFNTMQAVADKVDKVYASITYRY